MERFNDSYLRDSFNKYVTRRQYSDMKIDFNDYMQIEFPSDGFPEILRDVMFYMARVYLPFGLESLSKKPRSNNYFKKVTHNVKDDRDNSS